MNKNVPLILLVEWYCFPEEFGNLLQRSITANCVIQPILFPSTIQVYSFSSLIHIYLERVAFRVISSC